MSSTRTAQLQNETVCALHDSLVEKLRDLSSLIDTASRYCRDNERPRIILADAIAENIAQRADTSTEKELLALILKKIKG